MRRRERRAARLTLPATATSPARARQFVEETLAAWGAESVDDALLVVSELVTNGLLHARTRMTIALAEEEPGRVRLAVTDGSAEAPQQRNYSVDSGTGRGLRLLASIAVTWGVDRDTAGKTVWCVVRVDGAGAGFGGFDVDAVDAL